MSASTRRRQQFPKRYSLQLLDEQFAFRPCSECRVKFKSSFCHHLHSSIHKRTEKAKKKLICNVCGKSFAKLPNFLFHRTLHKIGSLDGDKAGILNKTLHGHGGDDGERVSAAGRIKHRRKSNPRKIKAQSDDDSVVIPDDRQSEVSGISKEGIQSFVDDKDEARRPVTPVNTGISQNEPTLSSVTSHFPILNNPSLTRPYQEHDQQPNYHLEHGENHAESTDNASYEDSTHTDIPDQVQMYFPNGNQNCPVCGKYFVKRWNLNRHYRAHLDDRPYQCVKCGAYFKELGHLNQHMVTHACSKPVKCEFCFATFARNESLRYHMRKAHHAYPDVDSCDSSDKASRVESPKPARRSSVEIYHHSRDMPQLIRVHNLDRPSSDTMHSVRFHDEGMPTLDVGYSNGVCRERQKPIISPEFYNGEEQTSVMLSSKSNACQRDRRVSDTIEPTRFHEKGTCTANQVIFYDRQEQSSNMPPTVTYSRDESYMSDTTDQGRYHEIDMKPLGYSTGMYSGGSDTLNSVELKVLNRGEVALSTKSSPAGIRSIPETLQYHEEGDMPALMPRPTRVFRERHASDPTGLYDGENRASNLSYKHSKRNSMSDVNDPKRFSEGQSQTSSMMYPSETYSIERSAPLLVDPAPLYEGERPTCSRSYPTREHSARRDMSAMMRPVESYNGESQRKQTAFQPETHNRDRHIPDTIFNSETSVRHSAESVRGSSYVDDTQRDRKECIDRMSDHRHSSFAHEDHIKQFRECETRIDDNQNEAKHGRLRDEYKQQFNKRSGHFYYCNYCKAGFTKEVDLEKHVVYFCDLQPDGYKKCASYKQGKISEYAVSSEVQHRGCPVFLAQRAEVTEEHTVNESKHRTTIFTPNVSSDCNDNDNSRYNLDHKVKDHYMPIKSHGMSPKGRDMPIRGHDMQIKGHNLPIKGDEMTIEGHDTPIRGHDMPIKGHHMPIKGHEMEIKGHEMEIKGHSVPIKGHDMPIKGHEMEITGHLYNVSFPNEETSHWSRNILTIPHDNSNLTEVRGNALICKTEEKYSIDDRENNSSCDCCPQSDPYIISTANCCNQVERMQGDDRQIKESRNCARLGSLNSTIPQSHRNSYSNITTINNQTKHPSYNTSDPKRNIFLSSDHQFIGERFRSLSSAIPGEATAMHVSSLAMTQPSTFDSLDTPSKTIPKLEQTIKVANISDFPGQAFDCGINNGFNASNLCHDSPTTNDGVRNRHIPQLVPSHPDASLYLQSQGRKSSPIHSLERLSFSDLRRADYAATKLEQIRPDLAPIRDAFRSRKRGRPAKMRISGPRCMSNVVPLRNVDSVPKQKRDSISGQGFTASGSKFHDKDAPASDHQVPVQAENETPNTSSGSLTKMHKMYFCAICGDYQTKRMHICRKKKTEKRKRRKNAKKNPEKVSFQTGKRFLEKERKGDCNNDMPYANSVSMSVENNNSKESGYLPFSNNKNACLKGVRNNDHNNNISNVNSKGSFVRNVDSNNVSYVDCKITPVENNNNNININNNMNNNNSINNNNNDINNNCETTSNSPSDTHGNDFDPTKLPFDSAMHMCSYCNKYQPATHICRRTEVYPFKCGECDKKFKHRHFYEKHLKKKHVS